MKKKTIVAVLTKKFNDFLESVTDPEIKDLVQKSSIITGGSIASMLTNEKVSDFDIYFTSRTVAAKVAKYYVDRFMPEKRSGIACKIYVKEDPEEDRVRVVIQSAGVASEEGADKPYEYFESCAEGEATEYVGEVMQDPGEIEDTYEETQRQTSETNADETKDRYRPVFVSSNAITLSNRIQLVLRFHGSPDEIHANYDFVHCTNYWTSWDKKLVLRPEALESLLARDLFYVGSKYPVCSVFRLRKFIRRGWTINAGQILKILMQVQALDLTNIEVLKDQLTGVDCAYFTEVIYKLADKNPEKVNSAYLIEIVDRMF